MKPSYIDFYLDGREAKLLKIADDEELVDKIVEKIMGGGVTVHEAMHAAMTEAAKSFAADRGKRASFVRDTEDEIKEAGGDEQAAWDHFVAGKVDELVSYYEEAVLECLRDSDEDEEEEE